MNLMAESSEQTAYDPSADIQTWRHNIENIYLAIGDLQPELTADMDFSAFDPGSHITGEMLQLSAQVTLFQYAERLSDQQAVKKLRTSLAWKYALHLPADYPGILPAALCEFRQSLFVSDAIQECMGVLIERLVKIGLLKRSQRCGNPLEIAAAICWFSRLEIVKSVMYEALELVAARQPEVLKEVVLPHWYNRYRKPYVASGYPDDSFRIAEEMMQTGKDAHYLLEMIRIMCQAEMHFEAVEELVRICRQQFLSFPNGGFALASYCTFCRAAAPVAS